MIQLETNLQTLLQHFVINDLTIILVQTVIDIVSFSKLIINTFDNVHTLNEIYKFYY